MSTVTLGRKVPAFKANATSETQVVLSKLKGERVVIFFYPKDNTPGCTNEAKDFRDLHRRFRRRNTRVFGVSRDSLRSHENFKAKQSLPFELISDPDEELCTLFDVIKQKNMYGRKVLGIERSTFLLDEKGILRREWRKVKVKGHAEEVLDAVAELPKP